MPFTKEQLAKATIKADTAFMRSYAEGLRSYTKSSGWCASAAEELERAATELDALRASGTDTSAAEKMQARGTQLENVIRKLCWAVEAFNGAALRNNDVVTLETAGKLFALQAEVKAAWETVRQ